MVPDEMYHLTIMDYELGSCYCRGSGHGGSVILCKPTWEIKPLEQYTQLSIEHHCEVSAIEIVVLNFILITVYRPPAGNFDTFLDVINGIFNITLSCKKYVLLNGDFNIHFEKDYSLSKTFLDLSESFDFKEIVRENTRGDHRLDNVFINFENVCECSVNVFDPDLSDHMAIECDVCIRNLTNSTFEVGNSSCRPITKKGIQSMTNLIQNENWSFLEADIPVEEMCAKFFEQFQSNRNVAFPVVKKTKKNSDDWGPEWFGDELRALKRELHVLSEMCMESECRLVRAERNALRTRYRNEINRAKKQANSNFIRNSDNVAKASWRLIKKHSKNTNSNTNVDLDPNDWNEYFSNIAENLVKSLPSANNSFIFYLQNSNLQKPNLKFSFHEVTQQEVHRALNNLKKKHSKDYYDLNVVLIQALGVWISGPLTMIFNKCIRQGAYPKEFKASRTVPLFKSGDQTSPSNYRPITLIPVFSKIFEALLKDQLCTYFENNDLLIKEQFGFRKDKSTTGAIVSLCDYVVEGFEEGQIVTSTFSDLSKAFDCVSHDILYEKLRYYGLDELSLRLLCEYHSNRRQITEINGKRSEERVMRHGVVQGSILGPLLFLIYVNDFASALPSCKVVEFADDNNFSIKSKFIEEAKIEMTRHTETATDWFLSNLLNVNLNKTETMMFSLKKTNIPENPEKIKFLGVTLDAKLTFESHVDIMSKKLCSATYVLRNISKIVDMETLKMAYYGLFHSVCMYGLLAWGHSPHAPRVFGLQRRAIRIIAGIKYRDNAKPFFKSLKILTLPGQYILEALLHLRRNLSDYTSVQETHDHNTRQCHNMQVDFLRLKTSWNATRHYAPTFFNKLPRNIRNIPLNSFKHKIKQFLIEKCFYSIEEFMSCQITDLDF